MTSTEIKQLKITACKVRMGIVQGTHAAKSGHPGGSLSAADMFTYLYNKELNVDPANPKCENRDRFVLSKGHTAPGLYATLAHRGFFPVEDLLTLRHIGSHLQGHPNMNMTPGVDMSTGSLGQGISAAAGMALAAKFQGKTNRVYTLLGDGEIQEGQVWEACMFAAHYKLDNFCMIVDNNGLQIDGNIADVMSPYPITDKYIMSFWRPKGPKGTAHGKICHASIGCARCKNSNKFGFRSLAQYFTSALCSCRISEHSVGPRC